MTEILRRTTDPRHLAPLVKGEAVVPAEYRQDAIDYLCERLSLGHTLREVCSRPDMPSHRWVRRKLNTDPVFKQQYIEALRIHALTEAANVIRIADGQDGFNETSRDRLRVDTRMKILAKLEPSVFGDKVEVDHNVTGELAAMLAGAKNKGHTLPHENAHTLPSPITD